MWAPGKTFEAESQRTYCCRRWSAMSCSPVSRKDSLAVAPDSIDSAYSVSLTGATDFASSPFLVTWASPWEARRRPCPRPKHR